MIPRSVIDQGLGAVPPQADAVAGNSAVPTGAPEGQQPPDLALRNQLDTIVGDLRIAQSRLGQIPVLATDRDTLTSLSTQYADLMDFARQLYERLNDKGDALGENLGISKEIDILQGDQEMFVGAVEQEIARALQVDNPSSTVQSAADGSNGNGNGAAHSSLTVTRRSGDNRMQWGLVVGGGLLVLAAGGGWWWYARGRRGVTAAR